MPRNTPNTSRPSLLLLVACLGCFLLGMVVLFIGALSHINPQVHFVGLFSREPIMNLVASIIPVFQ